MKTALLVIDVQAGLLPGAHQETLVLENINRVTAHLRATGGEVVYVQHCHGSFEPLMKGNPGWELHPGLARRPQDTVIEKTASDAFYNTGLQQHLASQEIQHLLISGLQTEYCVDTTCRRALSLGYAVTLISDAHTTGDSEWRAADVIAYHNTVLANVAHPVRNIRVQPAATVIQNHDAG